MGLVTFPPDHTHPHTLITNSQVVVASVVVHVLCMSVVRTVFHTEALTHLLIYKGRFVS